MDSPIALLRYGSTMVRGYVVYILMFAMLGVGLWAVLRIGRHLQAPAEIAGEWHVQWDTASPTASGVQGVMRVDQSGRYCTLEFDDKRTMSLKMIDGSALGEPDPKAPVARLTGEGYDVTLLPTAVHDAVRLEITGRESFAGVAERISRPSDERASGEPGATPTPAPVANARP